MYGGKCILVYFLSPYQIQIQCAQIFLVQYEPILLLILLYE